MAVAALSIKARALRWLAQREHSRAELERKLLRQLRDAPDARAQVAAALDELAARGLQSDARAAESVLAGAGRGLGSRRLRQTLYAKGLDRELVAACVQTARATELERARDLWRRRFSGPPADAAEHARQARFLLGRGFDGDIVRSIVGGDEG
jgi:regulatory protein